MAYREALPDEPAELAPVLCVHGFPQSSYVFIDDAGHFVFEDAPERSVRAVIDFLEQARV